MKNLGIIIDEIEARLDERDDARELCLKSSRAINRLASKALRQMHKGEDIDKILTDAREEVSKLMSVLAGHQELMYAGFVEEALQEYSEVVLFKEILEGKELSTPKALSVPISAYLLGLGDVVGELRRETMEDLRKGDLDRATSYLKAMEEIYDQLMRFDHPSAIVPIRRKQDVARTLVEKTRGEIAVASRGKELEDRIGKLEKKL